MTGSVETVDGPADSLDTEAALEVAEEDGDILEVPMTVETAVAVALAKKTVLPPTLVVKLSVVL